MTKLFRFGRTLFALLLGCVAATVILLLSIPYAIVYLTLKCILGETATVRVKFA